MSEGLLQFQHIHSLVYFSVDHITSISVHATHIYWHIFLLISTLLGRRRKSMEKGREGNSFCFRFKALRADVQLIHLLTNPYHPLKGWSKGEITPPRGRVIHHAHIVPNIQSHYHPKARIYPAICLCDGLAAAEGTLMAPHNAVLVFCYLVQPSSGKPLVFSHLLPPHFFSFVHYVQDNYHSLLSSPLQGRQEIDSGCFSPFMAPPA